MAKLLSKELGQRIETLRLHYGMSHEKLAARSGLSLSTTRRICKGEIGELDSIERIYASLGVKDQIVPALIRLLPDATVLPYDTQQKPRKRVRLSKKRTSEQADSSIWPEDNNA